MKRTLAVIGTAGRGQDAALLDTSHFIVMMNNLWRVIGDEDPTDLVSGGAAWADHAAVRHHQMYPWMPVHLFLPKRLCDRLTSQRYHEEFARVTGLHDTWQQVLATPHTDVGSFKDRNTCVANAADVFLAMTFGDGPRVKDGGTADTVRKMLARGVRGYHLDLFTGILHNDATV